MPQDQFETFVWKGQTRYRCGGRWESGAPCEFDCADREQIIRHMASPHLRATPVGAGMTPPPPPVPMSVSGTEARAAEFADARFADAEQADE